MVVSREWGRNYDKLLIKRDTHRIISSVLLAIMELFSDYQTLMIRAFRPQYVIIYLVTRSYCTSFTLRVCMCLTVNDNFQYCGYQLGYSDLCCTLSNLVVSNP